MNIFFSLLKKEFLLEFRSAQTATLSLFLIVLFTSLFALGSRALVLSSPESIPQLFLLSIWVTYAIVQSIGFGRYFEQEYKGGALTGVLLTGISPTLIYWSKVSYGIMVTTVFFSLNLLLSSLFFNQPLSYLLLPIGVAVSVGATAIMIIASAIAASSKLSGLLLPLISLPLLLPVILFARHLSEQLLESGGSFSAIESEYSMLLGVSLFLVAISSFFFNSTVRE